MDTMVTVPDCSVDSAAAALLAHVGERMRLVNRMTSVSLIPYVNPLVDGCGMGGLLSGTDFILKAVTSGPGAVDLMVEDCGTGKRWRMCVIISPLSNALDFHVVPSVNRRDRNLREVFG